MKVILLQDVARIGRRFEVKDVPHGHALNFLIPRKMAEPATKESLKRLEAHAGKRAEMQAGADEAFEALVAGLEGKTIEMPVEANEKGSLFQGIKASDIASFVSESHGTLSENHIMLDAPLKELGEHEVMIASGERKATITLNLVKK